MQKHRYIILLSLLALLLSGCPDTQADQLPSPPPAVQEADPAISPELGMSGADLTEEKATPAPLHSEFYLPDCTVEQVTEYFQEVVLNVEYTDGTGADHLVQKWTSPLYYHIYGTPTDTDLSVLNALFDQLNAIPGFPGIYPTVDALQENVSMYFLDPATFREYFSDVVQGEDAYGAVQFWYYTETNDLHTARIGYRTDLEQSVRNSILIEEVINGLGITDTVLRPDSITYQYSNEATELSDEDLAILKLLYSPKILCGMDAEHCAAVIRELYY